MKAKGRRPGRLWLFFYGRKRRGFPGLLVAVAAAALLLGLTFALPRTLTPYVLYFGTLAGVLTLSLLALVVLLALGLAVVASLRRRGRR